MSSAHQLISDIRSVLSREFHTPEVSGDLELQLAAGSTVCRVAVAESERGQLLVYVLAFILGDVPASASLYEYLALHSDDWVFGHLCAARDDRTDTVVVSIRHTLIGNHLNNDDLVETVRHLSLTANELDDVLRSQFGGTRWVDALGEESSRG